MLAEVRSAKSFILDKAEHQYAICPRNNSNPYTLQAFGTDHVPISIRKHNFVFLAFESTGTISGQQIAGC